MTQLVRRLVAERSSASVLAARPLVGPAPGAGGGRSARVAVAGGAETRQAPAARAR